MPNMTIDEDFAGWLFPFNLEYSFLNANMQLLSRRLTMCRGDRPKGDFFMDSTY